MLGLVIVSYRDRRTRAFDLGERVKAFSGIERSIANKLAQLAAATSLRDLSRPGNRLEALKGNRKGQYSIRINERWRICFEWPRGSPGPENVEVVDYH
jgi:proteic killer suppression protein